MSKTRFKKKVKDLLSGTDITINGSNPWDIQVHNEELFRRVLAEGSMGLGESYMEGWWDVEQLDEFFHRILRAKLDQKVKKLGDIYKIIKAKIFNFQKKSRAFEIGQHHYDIGNKLYRYMLDDLMIYSCGYWKNAQNLNEAQRNKLDLICRKLQLEPGMRVLDIGCGWGGAAKYAAENYGVEMVGVTVSEEQIKLGREMCKRLPVELRLQDYRDLNESFDRIFSIGMFEHVGYKNYQTFMDVARRNLKDNGLLLLHCIGGNQTVYKTDPWIQKYIFPNSMIPSIKQVGKAIEGQFVMEDWHNFGQDYDTTLMNWFKNFKEHWDDLKQKYDDHFFRMWKYYLMVSAGSFRARKNQLWQLLLSPYGMKKKFRVPH